ncbi:MAG TPA: tetratricopeptide repeat protein [Armatimonadota bacterium]|nr:tetratricopeptide repeat protein [Armatimonadota bacterium]
MASSGFSRTNRLLLGALPYAAAVLLGIGVYLRSVNGPFISDDWVLLYQIEQRPDMGLWGMLTSGYIHRLFGGGADFYRPLINASFLLDHALWENRTVGYHLLNLGFHAVCILLVALLAWLILRNRVAAIWAAFVFAAHPAHAESVCWISGRTDVFCAAFMLSGLCAYLAYRERKRKGFLALSLVLVLLAILSKELALVTLALVPLAAWVSGERSYRRMALDTVPYVILAAGLFGVRSVVLSGGEATGTALSPLHRLAVVAHSVFTEFQILLLPQTARLGYQISIQKILGPGTLIAFGSILVLTWSLWANRRWSRVPFFAAAWFLLTIVPVSVVAGSQIIAQRYLYVPSVGLAILFGWLMAEAAGNKLSWVRRLGMGVGIALIVILSLLSVKQSVLYTAEARYWERYVADTPLNPTAYYNLGLVYHKAGREPSAIDAFKAAADLAPDMAKAHYSLGDAYMAISNYDGAIRSFKRAAELMPEDPIPQQALELAAQRKKDQAASRKTP